ncbi:histidine phosphatase superfamily [Aspergillus cavernicola]|uniref:Histidine phosphatase superfamily n=1 Tax=Aspergillus cavernicola TaxID=176166 RepID=A0ABR4IWL9_9EURO
MKLSTLSASAALALSTLTAATHINYTIVPGYFLQDDESTDPSTFDYTANNFGLIPRTYDADKNSTDSLSIWQRFHRQLIYLNNHAPKHVSYKLFFMGRHGEGYHNAAEDYFGTPAWNCYYALLPGNTTHTWFDADLTPSGLEQAQIAHAYWLHQHTLHRIHFPDLYYTSPMTRALKTANITFTGLPLQQAHAAPFIPEVKEGFREGMSMHTCNHRRSKGYIEGLFPGWKFEAGFSEEDELWTGTTGETSEAQDLRSREALDDIFLRGTSKRSNIVPLPLKGVCHGGHGPGHSGQEDEEEEGKGKKDLVVSITAHSGEISSILRVIGHQPFRLSTGAVIPVLIRAEEVRGQLLPTTTTAWTVSAYCTEPPVTSVTDCVCASSAAPVTSGFPVFATSIPY